MTKKVINDMLYLEELLDARIHNFITEEVMRKDITVEDIDTIKESLIYVINERFQYIK